MSFGALGQRKLANKEGKATAMEAGGAYDVEEYWGLVRVHEERKSPMRENCCFDRFELFSLNLARAGKVGEIVHFHGASQAIPDFTRGKWVKRARLDVKVF